MPKDQRPPAFLFYPDDFCCDGLVEAMSTEEVGAYMLLLCKAWREEPAGTIPNDDRVLARWARLSPDRWTECKPAALAPFTLGKDGRWHQKRMRHEFDKLSTAQKTRTGKAERAARARWGNARSIPEGCPEHSSGRPRAILGDAISFPSSSPSTEEKPLSIHRASAWPDSVEAVIGQGQFIGLPEEQCRLFWDTFEAKGWIDAHGNPITNWNARLRRWMADWRAKTTQEAARHRPRYAATTQEQHAKGF